LPYSFETGTEQAPFGRSGEDARRHSGQVNAVTLLLGRELGQ